MLDVDLNGGNCQFTPVLEAIYHGHEHIAKFIIEKGSRIDQDLLKPAAEYGLTGIVHILLSKGVDANTLSYGETALEAAVMTTHNPEGHLELVKLLLENGANVKIGQGEPLVLRAAVRGYEDVTKLLIEAGAPLDGKASDGATIVHYATEFGYLGVIRALVAKEVWLDVQDNNERTRDPATSCSPKRSCRGGQCLTCSKGWRLGGTARTKANVRLFMMQ
jgi:ankyrin repeat protein